MRILGIDPGTRIAGYGLVDIQDGRISAVAAGVWRLGEKRELPHRLGQLSTEFGRVVDAFSPGIVCIELAFLGNNPRSAISLGHARGVILSQAALKGLVVHEISATAAKKSVVNFGQAGKEQVAAALEALLKVRFTDIPLDASDALAIAYAHALREIERSRLATSGGLLPSKDQSCSASWFGSRSGSQKFGDSAKSKTRKEKGGERNQGFALLLKRAEGGRS